MASSSQGKSDSHLRLVSDEDGIVVPNDANPSDESPTVISKAPPIVPPGPGSSQQKIVDLNRKNNHELMFVGLRGRRLAHYELIEPIGVGGMAAVIRARDIHLDRYVALKILPPEMAQEPENVARFHQEAKAAAKLDHENIARVFFCGEDQGLHFIAFEFVEGKNLRTMLEERRRLSVAESVRYILQVAAGLEHANTRGVVHRDVKPSNIIVTPSGRAKLVDMGLARNLERKGEHDLTQPGVTLGTFDYISPEQALEPRDADARSDIYSLGCTFYHLITGRAPVPEGTPAKKLQFHQSKAPLDPRSIDPTIPDEIVMILGRMMAKNPKDRYQRPIDLVHHLMQVAQRVGAANDIPEGVLLVDAPLPGRPSSRPLLYIGLALAVLIVFAMVASFLPDTPRHNGKSLIATTDKGPPKSSERDVTSPNGIGATPLAKPESITTVADLKSVLDDPSAPVIKAQWRETIDLEKSGLTIRAGSDQVVILEPDPEVEWATIRFHYKRDTAAFGVLLAGGKEITFRRIHFLIDYDTAPDRTVGMIGVSGCKNVKFEQCIFSQPNVPSVPKIGGKTVPLASIVVQSPDVESPRPKVTLDACHFEGNVLKELGGQMAVAVNGPAVINASNCAFRRHDAFFHIRDKSTLDQTILSLQNCTGFVTQGPVFRFNKQATALIRAQGNAFIKPDSGVLNDRPQPSLMYFSGESTFKFEGEQNLYRNLALMVERNKKTDDPQPLIENRERFQKFLAEHKSFDVNSEYLDATIDPMQYPNPLARNDELAFQLKAEYQLRFGLQRTWVGPMPKSTATPAVVKNPPAKIKIIVDPDDTGSTPGVFSTVKQALGAAKNGDTIYVRHGDTSRDVIVSPAEFEPGINVTLKPDTDYQPRLVLNKKFRDVETSIFKVRDGIHTFEGLEIVLDPGQNADVMQSVVQIGEAHCIFRGCVFTLRAANREQLAVVNSIDLDRMMKAEVAKTGRVEFHECFVRGKGDLIALNGCRLLDVDLRNSLVALDGSLLDIEPGSKAMSMKQGVRWEMDHSSIFTTESVFALRSKLGKVLTETQADVKNCLLASLIPEQLVVNFDRDVDMGVYLKWRGEQNYYANFDKLRDWKEQFPEPTSNYGKFSLGKLTENNMKSLWDATPDWFRPTDAAEEKSIQGIGQPADAEKRMMQPILEPDEPSS